MLPYNDVVNKLQDYMLDEINIQKSLRFKLNNEKPCKKIEFDVPKAAQNLLTKAVHVKKSLFVPKEQDSLFWCYYIIKNGDTQYEMLNHKNILMAKQFKIDYVDIVRKNKQILKTYKFDTITNIESNLANDMEINIKTVLALCAIHNINVIYVRKRTYYELLMNDTSDTYIIKQIPSNTKYNFVYGFEKTTSEKLQEIHTTLYKLGNVDKPIKSISSYKSQDIIDIANKLEIEIINNLTGKTKTKKDLYEAIIQYF